MSREQKKNAKKSTSWEGGTHRPIPEWLAVKLDFPPDVLEGGMRVDLRGRHSVTVYGCRRILYYGTERISLGMKDCVLHVTGVRLVCASYLAGAVGIDGQIDGIRFEDGEGEA